MSQNKNGFEENKKRKRNINNLITHKSKKNFKKGRGEVFRGNPKKDNNGYIINE